MTRVAPRSASRNAAHSTGSGADSSSGSPSTGCANASDAACRNMRFRTGGVGRPREPVVQREVAVLVVADDRTPEVREVHADLVRPAGLQLHVEQARRRRLPGREALDEM